MQEKQDRLARKRELAAQQQEKIDQVIQRNIEMDEQTRH